MPRKRAIKPDFNGDCDIAVLSPWARLFYIGLWGQMDRNGLIEDNPKLLRARVFPLDDHSLEAIEQMRDELLRAGPSGRSRLVRVIHNGKNLLFCPTFVRHQKIYRDEPAIFDVSELKLIEIRKKAEKGQPVDVDSLPQPGTVPVTGTGEWRAPDQSRASASASTSTSNSTSPSASAWTGPARSGGDESNPVFKLIDGLIVKGGIMNALEMISRLPVRDQAHYADFIAKYSGLGRAPAEGNA